MRALLPLVLLLVACGENRTYPDRDAYVGAQPAPLTCLPNLDGQITPNELQAATGIPVSYLLAPSGISRGIDVAGKVDGAGKRVWDFSADYADDRVLRVAAKPLTGAWYASSFPNGQFATPSDSGGTLDGIYAQNNDALFLLGIASATENPPEGKTLLIYSTPIALFRFPITPGKSWISISEVRNSTIRGLPYAARDTYRVNVDASGELKLPDLTFTQAHRVRVALTIEPAVGAVVQRRQVSFLTECFGEVTRAVSPDGTTQDDFTSAQELRRLGL